MLIKNQIMIKSSYSMHHNNMILLLNENIW